MGFRRLTNKINLGSRFISDLTWITYLVSMISINIHICLANLFHLTLSNWKTRSMKKFNCVTNFKCLTQARIDKKEVSAYDYLFFSPPRFLVLPLVYNISFGPAITALGCVNTIFMILLWWAAIAYISPPLSPPIAQTSSIEEKLAGFLTEGVRLGISYSCEKRSTSFPKFELKPFSDLITASQSNSKSLERVSLMSATSRGSI